jgi:hypothetical protein
MSIPVGIGALFTTYCVDDYLGFCARIHKRCVCSNIQHGYKLELALHGEMDLFC